MRINVEEEERKIYRRRGLIRTIARKPNDEHPLIQIAEKAFCSGTNTDKFFGLDDNEALKLCRQCPVIVDCLEWARAHHEKGIWGGTTDEDRAGQYKPRKPQISNPSISDYEFSTRRVRWDEDAIVAWQQQRKANSRLDVSK
jgi:WhiB family redox-sensing transcriptional regulator